MKALRERIINVVIPSFTTSTTYRVPKGYNVTKVSVGSSSISTATISVAGVTVGTCAVAAANTRYPFQYDYTSLAAGSWTLGIAISAGTGFAYIELSNERPTTVGAGTGIDFTLTASQYAIVAALPKAYTAFISQSGTTRPLAATLLRNTIGTVTWERVSAGTYTLNSTGLFTQYKTTPEKIYSVTDSAGNVFTLIWTSANVMTLKSYAVGDLNNPADAVLSRFYLNIEVYS